MNWWWALAYITCYFLSLLKFTMDLRKKNLFFKEKKHSQHFAGTNLMRLFLILLLALCSRAFLSRLRPDKLVLCKYGYFYVMLVFSSSMGCWLVEPKIEVGDKSPQAWWDWASSLKRNPLRSNQMLRNHFQFRKLLNWKNTWRLGECQGEESLDCPVPTAFL